MDYNETSVGQLMVKHFNIRIFPQLYIDSSEKMQRGPCKGDPSYKNFFRFTAEHFSLEYLHCLESLSLESASLLP